MNLILGGIALVRIKFQSIHIDQIAASSSVNKGTNRIVGRRSNDKVNNGLGAVRGEGNLVQDSKHIVYDADTLDYKPRREKS
ncbi:hypothetical protein [Paenibacillus whitsoniae]|uniref:Uncharacterized protein n=1 Tax=Paenibacillus whitsoniae TaxID=2496558 RepID=A0A3S0BWD3_9BACL|nr:hypothetical protein [Paenibacillus whitsoniae]RTE09862.1 hypothetical protein EJQ19_10015 [Paenibacillus whitsoniae]